MKRSIKLLMLLFVFSLTACGRRTQPELAEDVFIKLSTNSVGVMESYKMCTMNIEIHQNGTVRIYADGFYKWLSDEECPVCMTQITSEETDELKGLIAEYDLYNMREDVGNKDSMDGDKKYLTLYTVDGEHTVGGLNPSNRAFLKIFDYINALVREELYTYKLRVYEMQEQGCADMKRRGVKLTDNHDDIVLTGEMIDSYEILQAEAEDELSTVLDAAYGEEQEYYVIAMHLNDEGTEIIAERTVGCNEKSPEVYYLYKDDTYVTTICVDYQIIDGVLYLSDIYSKEDAEALVGKISGSEQ